MTQRFDVIVLGLGAMGSAATWQLARAGAKVLGIDQYNPPHRLGSTHGESRITRIACGEGAEYTSLARRSHQIWNEIEQSEFWPEIQNAAGLAPSEKLLTVNGWLLIGGPEAGPAHGAKDFVSKTKMLAEEYNVEFESLAAQEIRSRFSAFNVGDDEHAYLDHVSGFVRPEACITAQLMLARKEGAITHVNESVREFKSFPEGVRVYTDKDCYDAGTLIVTAGPWLPGLLEYESAQYYKIRRQVLYWFAPRDDETLARFQPDRCPVYVWLPPNKPVFYGFPALAGIEGGVKIATEQEEFQTSPALVNRSVSDAEKKHMYEEYIRPYLPGLTSRCLRAEVCLYTQTPDTHFIIDRHPVLKNIIIASPCSGHGFKHSAAVGELLAKYALGQETPNRRFGYPLNPPVWNNQEQWQRQTMPAQRSGKIT